jgi:hypothetical protein
MRAAAVPCAFLSVLLVCPAIMGAQSTPETTPVMAFFVGQVWSYHTRPGEEGSTVQVVRIDRDGAAGTIIHISVDGLKIRNPRVSGGIQTTIPHAPIAEEALRKSVVSLLRVETKLRPFEEGFKLWAAAKGGVFTIPVSQLPAFAENALR